MTTQHLKDSHVSPKLSSLSELSTPLSTLVGAMITAANFNAKFTAQQVEQLLAIAPSMTQLLRDLVPLAQSYSHAPISNFHVGAVALSGSGAIYLGANIEFKGHSLGQTIHAEQCAITNAWNHDELNLKALAISAVPCGHCRQFINELSQASDIEVLLPEKKPLKFSQLLPLSFGPTDLGVNDRLMQSQANPISLIGSDDVAQAAIDAARASYSPYSDSPSGVAIATTTATYTGRYAENCAYNPSLSPLQGALINLHLAGDKFEHIKRVVLVEKTAPQVSQQQSTTALIEQFAAPRYTRLTF